MSIVFAAHFRGDCTHGTANRLPDMQEAWYQILEHGRFVQTCEGPCDPD